MDEVKFLRELLEIYSPSGQEAPLADYLMEKMAEFGFDVQIDEVGNMIGVLGTDFGRGLRGQGEIVLLGHMDTVPGFIPVRLEGGRLYGRGAVDAKGPLAAFILAAAKAAPRLRDGRITVIGAICEEADGEGAKHLVHRFHPAIAIIGEPSGWDGITLGYKGRLVIHYRLSTPVAHTASPEPSAPEKALAFWWRLSSYAHRFNRDKGRRFDCLDVSLRRINSSGNGLYEEVEMTIGVRTPPRIDVARLQRRLALWTNGPEARFAGGEEAFIADKNTLLVRAFLRAIRALGGKPRFKLKTGTSDMNVVGPVWGCPIVAYGPGHSSLDHTPDEYIEIEEYLRTIEVLERVLTDTCDLVSQEHQLQT